MEKNCCTNKWTYQSNIVKKFRPKTADISCKSYILQKNNRLNIIAVSKKPWHMNDKIKIKYQDLLGLSG